MANVELGRGFRAEAERLSIDIRKGVGIRPDDRLDPVALAEHLGIATLPLNAMISLGASPWVIRLLERGEARFCAMTVMNETSTLIVFNSQVSSGRCANSLAHELSHMILDHSPGPALGGGGCRQWHPYQEAEADWLAGALLAPREGILQYLIDGGDLAEGPRHFGISRALFRWRYNITGVSRQLSRWHAGMPSTPVNSGRLTP